MGWSSLLVIVSSSLLFFAKSTASLTMNYVKPLVSTTASPCPDEHKLCLTLGEYTSDSDVYFVNNTIFYFYPGNHRLDDSLILENLYNVSFQGLPNGDQIVNVSVDSLASITWKESWNVEISSIRFILLDNFSFILKFESSQIVQLSNISIFGNEYSGCSSVLIQESAIIINNSTFTEISGVFGAAVMMEASNVTFRGNNAFVNNAAISGGSIYLSDSRLTFNGTSLFLNNTSKAVKYYKAVLRPSLCYSRDIVDKFNNGSGGAIFCITSYLRFYEHSNFTGNSADLFGGAIAMKAGALTIQGVASFVRNRAWLDCGAMFLCDTESKILGYIYQKQHNETIDENGYGGAIYILKGELIIQGNTLFDGNFAEFSGGALYIIFAKVIFYGNNSAIIRRGEVYANESKANKCFNCTIPSITFLNNTAHFGGSIYCREECDVVFIGTVYFNYSGGSALDLNKHSSITFTGDTYFYRNTGYHGGAIQCHDSNITLSGMAYFEGNTAYQGGAINLEGTSKLIFKPKLDTFNNSIIFLNNTADSGGSISSSNECQVVFIGTMYFNYSAGSAIELYQLSSITFTGDAYFYRNTGYYGGAIYCQGISYITLSGTVYFEDNTAYQGGAMFLTGTSKLIFKPKLDIFFISNYANDSGGALYFEDSQCSVRITEVLECFITIDGPISTLSNISLHFENNSARSMGSILYGGRFDECGILFFKTITTDRSDQCGYKSPSYIKFGLETLINMSTIVQNDSKVSKLNINDTVLVYFPTNIIRFCEVDGSNLFTSTHMEKKNVYPGQQFDISLIAFQGTSYPVPTTVYWKNARTYEYLSPPSKTIESSCTTVSVQLHSGSVSYITFKLYPENPCPNLVEQLTLSIHVLPCPIGFNLSLTDSKCVCDKKLKKLTQNCYIGRNSESVERMKNSFWIYKTRNEILILHEYRCPLDYCKDTPEYNVSLSDPSVQCEFNRNGTLCGKCLKNFSLALGSLHCMPCDNKYSALILFFTMAGVALVAVIFLLQLTVPVGTLSGVFFYANIVQANHQAFFPRATINFFTVFISWLNLDLGIETCFYDGMDIYAYSWFQFLFPFYLWFLIGCIIVVCRYSQSIAKQFGQNPVAVLATLFLMSYSKLLQAIIVPLSLTYLTYYTPSNETQSIVWLYDASIDYFKEPKHIALGLFAITSVVVFVLPYILLLFFDHWLQGCSNWWILSWLNKLKPFMDAYHAPYKKHTRYWTGLLLLSRLGLFLTFAINVNGSESVNILAVSSVCLALLGIKLLRVYENLYKDILESSFILNLGIFSVATFYLKEESRDDDSQLILLSTSVGITFITFIGVLIFHISLVLKSSRVWKDNMLPFIQSLGNILRVTTVNDNVTARNVEATVLHALPTTTEVAIDLNKPLLEITADTAAYN